MIDGSEEPNESLFYTEGDFSGAAFMLVAGAIGGKVSVKGLNPDSIQGDAKIIEIIKKFGALKFLPAIK